MIWSDNSTTYLLNDHTCEYNQIWARVFNHYIIPTGGRTISPCSSRAWTMTRCARTTGGATCSTSRTGSRSRSCAWSGRGTWPTTCSSTCGRWCCWCCPPGESRMLACRHACIQVMHSIAKPGCPIWHVCAGTSSWPPRWLSHFCCRRGWFRPPSRWSWTTRWRSRSRWSRSASCTICRGRE